MVLFLLKIHITYFFNQGISGGLVSYFSSLHSSNVLADILKI